MALEEVHGHQEYQKKKIIPRIKNIIHEFHKPHRCKFNNSTQIKDYPEFWQKRSNPDVQKKDISAPQNE